MIHERTAIHGDLHRKLQGSSGMGLSVELFQARLAESAVLDADILDSALVFLAQALPHEEAEPWARELVNRQYLTRFQAASLLRDKVPSLVHHNYILLERLWAGRMAEVFRAQHRHLNRIVAIKMLSEGLQQSPEDVARFRREVEIAGKLEHPNIITAYDANEANGVPFLVMQHVTGVDLDVLVRLSGPLAIGDAAYCLLQAARGLAHTHACGVVHRDIKPGNMILGTDGLLRILDLGLAWFDADSDGTTGNEEMSLRQPMGTAGFHAPEQARLNAPPDSRSDLCSLGYTLYYLLTGTTAYEEAVPDRHLGGNRQPIQPSLRRLRPEVPQSLEDLFQRLTAFAPEDRYQSAGQLIDDLLKSGLSPQRNSPQLQQNVRMILNAQETFRSPGVNEPLTTVDSTWEGLGSLHPTAPLPRVQDSPLT